MHIDRILRFNIAGVFQKNRRDSPALFARRRAGSFLPIHVYLLFAILLLPSWVAAQSKYDLVLKGGEVVDPRSGTRAVRDIGVRDHKIAAIEKDIPATNAIKVISVRGLLVTPGLIDIHTHDYAGTGRKGAYDGDSSVYPDDFTFRSCVTTVVDAGSSGWRNFPDFKDRVIDRSKTRVLALLNIVGKGMGGETIEQDTGDMDASATADQAKKYKDTRTTVSSRPWWVSAGPRLALARTMPTGECTAVTCVRLRKEGRWAGARCLGG